MQAAAANELELFHRFLGEQLKSGRCSLSPEDSVGAFRAYQREVEELCARLQVGIDQADRGEAKPLDVEALKRRIADRVTQAASS